MKKRKLFEKSLFLHRKIAAKWHLDVTVRSEHEGEMAYDMVAKFKVPNKPEYVRYRALELVAEEIERHNVGGECAEAGVFLGTFSGAINRCFPDRKLHLYDTFEGFNQKDMEIERRRYEGGEEWLNINEEGFRADQYTPEQQMKLVSDKMVAPENCVFHKGYFPETAEGEKNTRFAFVSLDMDLYKPLKDGLIFFYPLLTEGRLSENPA